MQWKILVIIYSARQEYEAEQVIFKDVRALKRKRKEMTVVSQKKTGVTTAPILTNHNTKEIQKA